MKFARAIIFFAFIFTIRNCFGSLIITEIMYNPVGSDYDLEYIEIYNNGSEIDLTNYSIDGNNFGDVNISNGEYIVIARELIDTDDEDTLSFESVWGNADGTWNISDANYTAVDGYFSLANDHDIINLSDKTNSIIVKYSNTGYYSNSSYQLINTTWINNKPSPGKKNIYVSPEQKKPGKDLEIEVLFSRANIDLTYNKLFKIINLDHISGITDKIFVKVKYNISKNKSILKKRVFNVTVNSYTTANTGSFMFNESGNYSICARITHSSENDTNLENNRICKIINVVDTTKIACNVSLKIDTEKLFYNNSERISFKNNLSNESFSYKITYWITDLFGNYIKDPYTTQNTNKKSYTANIKETDQVLIIKSNITNIACNDSYKKDNYAEKMVIIKGKKDLNSNLKIDKIYTGSDNKASFGDFLRVRFSAYKGDTQKTSVKTWIEDDENRVSYITYSNINSKYDETEITVPVRIKPNCNEKYREGRYSVVVSGLDVEDRKDVVLKGITNSLCKKTKSTSSDQKTVSEDQEKYEITELKEKYYNDEKITFSIKVNNKEKQNKDYDIWSYIYRGPKSYSGNRISNIKHVSIPGEKITKIDLENKLIENITGDFKIKIKIQDKDRKTPDELTEDIKIIGRESEKTTSLENEIETDMPKISSFYTLSRKYDEEINLYAGIENLKKNLSLILDSYDSTKHFDAEKKNKFNVKLVSGKNLFLLTLFENDKEIDKKELIIFATESELISYQDTLKFYSEKPDFNSFEIESSMDSITGNAVKKEVVSSKEKTEMMLPALIIFSIALSVAAYLKLKK
ncbi:hypothetical protein GF327_03465 [Candidatus Woesearchaeota archaeon]|nr:hypothetical protein [Candidatus Woesearchaeota archaeon]